MTKGTQMSGRQYFSVLLLVIVLTATVSAQNSQLGKVEFATSGSEKAQAHFLRGLAALHSFWYEEALEAFREATKVEPDFMMGYWGEAMAHNHTLWSEQDFTAAREVIGKIKGTPKLTARERAYLAAVKLLYGEGNKRERDTAYSVAMEKVYKDYGDDLDAAAFYSLSLLGLMKPEEKSYRLQARAGAIALEVYQKNPNHPGAAHYIIHSFDDPEHAILALPAARRYATIAPEAYHARHMPSHIFLQLGMWPEAASSNEAAWESSDTWMKRKNLSPSVRDYHSLHWLLYVYLQQGRYHKAEELLSLMKKTMSESSFDNKLRPNYYENNYANMAAAFVVETERWQLAQSFFPADAPAAVGQAASSRIEAPAMPGSHGGHGASAPVTADGPTTVRASNRGKTLPLFVRGLSYAVGGSAEVESMIAALRSSGSGPMLEIRELEIAALAASMKKDHATAIDLMKKAVALEEQLGPPSGPPQLVKPSHELNGEVLLRAGKPDLALEQFKISLLRQPNRARSLLGAARAAAQSGDQRSAASYYATLVEQWKHADEGLPELREAHEFVKKAGTIP
ncbi:MAG TPA: tetratricopeptide repeat protein [Pyrinomonadaceae bacterium]|nr:tetratricopeptide repeat protein [Pyrinomonadaceae bacterium]